MKILLLFPMLFTILICKVRVLIIKIFLSFACLFICLFITIVYDNDNDFMS